MSYYLLAYGVKENSGYLDITVALNEYNKIYLPTPYLNKETDDVFNVIPITDNWLKEKTGLIYTQIQQHNSLEGFIYESELYKSMYSSLFINQYNSLNGYIFQEISENQVLLRLNIDYIGLKGIMVNNSDRVLDEILKEIQVEIVSAWSFEDTEDDRRTTANSKLARKEFNKTFLENTDMKISLLNDYLDKVRYIYSKNKS